MSDSIDIKIKSSYEGSGSQAAIKDIERLSAATKNAANAKAPDPGYGKVATQAQAAAKSVEGLTAAEARNAATAERLATAQARSAAASASAAAAHNRQELSALRLAQAQEKAATSAQRSSGYFDQMGQAMAGGVMAVVGPAAIAGTAISGLVAVADRVKQAFVFTAELDATTNSIKSQLDGFRDVNATYNEAIAFGKQYQITQQETNNILSSSTDILRTSTASVTELETALIRLQSRDVSKPISEASRALRELQAGDVTSIKELFNVPAADALKMRNEIAAGGDAVKVLTSYLDGAKIGMGALEQRTQGAMGKLNELKVAQEAFTKALGGESGGVGLAILETKINVLQDATRVLTGNFRELWEAGNADHAGNVAEMEAYNAAIARGVSETEARAQAAAAGATAEQNYMAWIQSSAGAQETYSGAAMQAAQITMVAADADERKAAASQTSAAASQIDAAAKQEQASKTQLLEAQTNAAASAFLALHPGITASGVASLAAAGQIDPLIAQLIQARMRALDAANALAQFNALQGVKATVVKPREAQNEIAGLKRDNVASDRQARAQVAAAEYAAQKERTLAIGTNAQKIALYQKEYDAAVKMYGAGSVEAFKAQTKVLDAQQQGTNKRVGAANTAAAKLEGIEQKTGDKLTDIVSKTQDRLAAVDAKGAEQRLAAAKRLNQALAANAADRRASSEADDLDLVGPMDDKEAQKLNDRERAQASAREREKAAAAEARAGIERGEAETAEKVYAAREEQIQAQQQLDERYYAKQRELADNPEAQAALTQQYDEAVRAADEAAQMRIMFAQAAAEEAAGAAAEEKQKILADAEEQANKVISASERSAAGVKKATASARDEAIASIRAIGDSINALPAEKRIKISVDGSGGVSTAAAKSDGAYAGGGSFMTHGPTTITVGDNPGGAELVTVTPISGSGTTRAAPGTIALAGGGTVLADAGDGYTTPVAGTGGSGGKKGKGKAGGAAAAAKDQIAEQKAAIDLLSDLIKLRHDMAAELENGTPFDVAFAERLSNAAAAFASFVRTALPASTKAEAEAFKLSADNTKQSIGILADMIDLRKDLADWQSVNPIDLAFVQRLAATAAEVTRIVMGQLVPTTQLEVDRLGRWAELENAAVSLISDVTKLNQRMFSDYVAPSDAQLDMVVKDADRIADRMIVAAKKYDTKGLEAAKLYGDALGGFYGTAKDALLFNQAINSGDFDQNQANLDKFERAAGVAIGVAKRLGAEAATIPSTDLAALQLTTQALAAQSEALIKLAAVPFGDLPGAAANLQSQAAQLLGGAKGGGATTNVYMTVNALPGMSARDVAAEAVRLLGQQVGSRK